MAPSMVQVAVRPSMRSAATNVSVFQCPCGTHPTRRFPRGKRPWCPRRRVVKRYVVMAFQPFFILFVGVEIIENDLQPLVRIFSHDFVHEFQKLLAAPTLLVGGLNLAGRHFKGSEQHRGVVALVIVAFSRQSTSIRQL